MSAKAASKTASTGPDAHTMDAVTRTGANVTLVFDAATRNTGPIVACVKDIAESVVAKVTEAAALSASTTVAATATTTTAAAVAAAAAAATAVDKKCIDHSEISNITNNATTTATTTTATATTTTTTISVASNNDGATTPRVQQQALEVAGGSGQHLVALAKAIPALTWTPSDMNPEYVASQTAYALEAGLENVVSPAVFLDCTEAPDMWPVRQGSITLIFCANMVHIAPWKATIGLFAGAGRALCPGAGVLVLYGPFAFEGSLVPDSNVRFHASLRHRNPEWGVRDTRDLEALAKTSNLKLTRRIPMPANNHILVFERRKVVTP
eukprot:UC1_evm2s1904